MVNIDASSAIDTKVKEAIKIKSNTAKLKEFMLSGKKMIKDAILIKEK